MSVHLYATVCECVNVCMCVYMCECVLTPLLLPLSQGFTRKLPLMSILDLSQFSHINGILFNFHLNKGVNLYHFVTSEDLGVTLIFFPGKYRKRNLALV